MRVLVQRSKQASVHSHDKKLGSISFGLVVLAAIGQEDTDQTVKNMAEKIVHLRIFEDQQGLMNKSLIDVQGQVLAISQFTLYADCRKGRRPYFGGACKGEKATELFDRFCRYIKQQRVECQTGEFGADMQVHLINDGPVTIWLDSFELEKPRSQAITCCDGKRT